MSERITLPVVPLRGSTLFPGVTALLRVGRKGSLRALDRATSKEHDVILIAQRGDDEAVDPSTFYEVGVQARVAQMQRGSHGVQVAFEGLARVRILEMHDEDGVLVASVVPVPDLPLLRADDPTIEALALELRERAVELAKKKGVPASVVGSLLHELKDLGVLTNVIAHHLEVDLEERQSLLSLTDVEQRMRRVLVHVQRALLKLHAQEDIQSQVQAELGARQRQLFLREQMRAIQRELGEGDEDSSLEELRERLEELSLPDVVQQEVDRELARLSRSGRESMDAQVIRNYLEWISELPWQSRSENKIELGPAAEILDSDHFGLRDVKDRVLEFLAVRKLHAERAGREAAKPDEAQEKAAKAVAKGPILLFSGPPGVGKTSVGKSIAKALGRKYVRIALGGVRDEADIRGHRRTYVGAMPGRIVQALKQAGTKNPVILLDEVDKLGASYQGNPASALLEVLDPAQNDTFTDHYLNVPFDLSEVLFIATANYPDQIPAPLRDRMDAIDFSGYTEREKVEIGRRYLVPRQLDEAGLAEAKVTVTDEALEDVVQHYTRESGVRQLEREIGRLARKLSRRLASGETTLPTVDKTLVRELLGRPRVRPEKAAVDNEVGVATGMYYTPMGGDIMFVEASIRRQQDFRHADTSMQVSGWGNVSLILTGQLGDVMKESARAALTYAATRAPAFRIPEDKLGSIEAHIHVPAGAIPKDGPSAGVAMATALISAMSGRAVRKDVAMTGEVTLRGHVLPIGGVKEKVLGAHRAGIKHIILPKDNEADLEDLPDDVRADLGISCVATLDQVLDIALVKPEAIEPPHRTADDATGDMLTH